MALLIMHQVRGNKHRLIPPMVALRRAARELYMSLDIRIQGQPESPYRGQGLTRAEG